MLIEERVNRTYKWVMLIVATIAQTTATLINVWCRGFRFILERRICTYEIRRVDLLVSVCKCWAVILYAFFVGRLLDQYNEKIFNFYQFIIFAREFTFTD